MSHTPKKKPPKGSGAGGCFHGCFGFSHSDNFDGGGHIISKENSKPSLDGSITIEVPKRRKWFSWARKQRSPTKTVPFDATVVPEKPRRSWSMDVNNMVKRKKKGGNTSQPLLNHVNNNSILFPATESSSNPVVQQTSRAGSSSDQQIILRKKKISSKPNLDSIEEATASQENSAAATPIAATSGKSVGHSISLPSNSNNGGDSASAAKKSKETVVGRRVDSVVGMSIILVMLLIMLVWGKVCAILCTSAWLYFVPRFRIKDIDGSSKANENGSSSSLDDQIAINSPLYKKKIVLEGILERKNNNHRSSVVFN